MQYRETLKKMAVAASAVAGGIGGFILGVEGASTKLNIGQETATQLSVTVEPTISNSGDNTAELGIGPLVFRKKDLNLPIPYIGAKIAVNGIVMPDNKLSTDSFSDTLGGLVVGSQDIENTLKRQYLTAFIMGLVGCATVGSIAEVSRRKGVGQPVAMIAALGSITANIGYNQLVQDKTPPRQWTALEEYVPFGLQDIARKAAPIIGDVEVQGDYPQLRKLIAAVADDKYFGPKTFIDSASQKMEKMVRNELSDKKPGEVRVLAFGDSHDNSMFAPYFKTAADATKPDVVLGLGDYGSSGSHLEQFFVRQQVKAFSDVPNKVYVRGNHDGDGSLKPFEDAKGIELDGKTVNVAGVTITGIEDNFSSVLGMSKKQTGQSYDDEKTRLADLACEQHGNIVVAHNPELLEKVIKRACGELAIAGHVHYKQGPSSVINDDGTKMIRYVSGASTGPEGSFSFGMPVETSYLTVLSYLPETRPNSRLAVRLAKITVVELSRNGYLKLETTTFNKKDIYTADMFMFDRQRRAAEAGRNILKSY